jgi:uncharacterized membrane protein YgcG
MAIFGSLAVVPWILFAQSAWDMDVAPSIAAIRLRIARPVVDIWDRGEVFGHEAVNRAREALQGVHARHDASVLVETVQSLDGAWVADVAQRRARMSRPDQLYILVAGDEREVGVIGARRGPTSRLTDQDRETIRLAFLRPIQEGKADEAIRQGVRAIGMTLDAAARPTPSIREFRAFGAILLTSLVILSVFRFWPRRRGRDERHSLRLNPIERMSSKLKAGL